MRFRENEVVICADISKMYHRICIPEQDQQVHRFLWRNMDLNKSPDVYIKTVLTFGDKPAPAMAQTALRKTAEAAEHRFPHAARVLTENTYMDDICDSVCTVEEAIKLTKEVDEVLSEGGFAVKGWLSNKPLRKDSWSQGDVPLPETPNQEKVLGTVWNHETDEISFKVTVGKRLTGEDHANPKLTKRYILSQIASIFDPLGFAAAFLIRAKIGMQHLWQQGLDWDEELPTRDQNKWMTLFKEMQSLNHIAFPRCLSPSDVTG